MNSSHHNKMHTYILRQTSQEKSILTLDAKVSMRANFNMAPELDMLPNIQRLENGIVHISCAMQLSVGSNYVSDFLETLHAAETPVTHLLIEVKTCNPFDEHSRGFAESPFIQTHVQHVAFASPTAFCQMLSHLFVDLLPKHINAGVFTNTEEAMVWLNTPSHMERISLERSESAEAANQQLMLSAIQISDMSAKISNLMKQYQESMETLEHFESRIQNNVGVPPSPLEFTRIRTAARNLQAEWIMFEHQTRTHNLLLEKHNVATAVGSEIYDMVQRATQIGI